MQQSKLFFQAVFDNEATLIANMLKQKQSLAMDLNEEGSSALHIAATEGYIDLAEVLIMHGANIDQRDAWGRTPLIVSIYVEPLVEHEPMVQMLLSKGAAINIAGDDGSTALHMASFGEPNLVKLLLEHKADINVKDNKGMTPLHNAVLYPERETVRILLTQQNIEKDVKNQQGLTPLDIARQKGWYDLVRLIDMK